MSRKLHAAVALGRLGGKAKSEKKTLACRLNARKPRPRKAGVDGVAGMTQPDLFTRQPAFDGATFEPAKDAERLTGQLATVRKYMRARYPVWRSLAELHERLNIPEASISARMRDLRKSRFGSYVVERQRRSPGTFEYRVRP